MRYPWPWAQVAHSAVICTWAACSATGSDPGMAPTRWTPCLEAEIAPSPDALLRPPLPDWIRKAVGQAILDQNPSSLRDLITLRYAVFAPSNATRLVAIVSDQGAVCAPDGTLAPYRMPRRPCPVYAVAIDAAGHVSPIHQGWGCLPARDVIEPDGRVEGFGVEETEFRYNPGTRQIEGQVRNTETDAVACRFSVSAPSSAD